MIVVLLAMAILQDAAPAPVEAPPPATSPRILAYPDGGQVAAVYPGQALHDHIGGRATVECLTTAKGPVETCKVISETPAGAGFGEAALKLIRHYRIKSVGADGEVEVGRTVKIPIVWSPPRD